MKINNYRWILVPILLVLAPVFLWSQDDETDEEIVTLSPFSIDETENVGYTATTTLAGTRLKTKLEDVGAAVSVYTQEFMEDIAATDSETLLPYAVNAESAGIQGNFANGVQQDSNRINPHVAQRIRGLNAATLTRNYFTTDIPFDGYNTQSVTINRGPNSLLFGIGSAGGVIENSLRTATVLSDRGSASLRLGERGSHRGTFDVNKVLIKDRLAVRVAGVYDDEQYKQRPAFERDKRLYASFEAVLRKGEDSWFGRTTLRGGHEEGIIKSNRPNVVPPVYGFEHWFDDENSLSRADASWFLDHSPVSQRGQDLNGGQFFWLNSSPNLGTPKALYDSNRPAEFIKHVAPYDRVDDSEIVQGWLSDGSFRDHPDVPPPHPGNQNLGFNSIGTPITLQFFGPLAMVVPDHTVAQFGNWDSTRNIQAQPGFTLDFKPRGPAMIGAPRTFMTTQHQLAGAGFRVPTMPLEMIDNNNLLLTGDMNRVKQDFDATDFTLEQILFDGKGGIEFAMHEESYDTEADLTFSPEIGAFGDNRIVAVDLSIWTRDGAALNPNVGRPLMTDFIGDKRFTQVDRESWRINAFYEFDFTEDDGFSRHFGRHIVSGIKLHDERTVRNQQTRWHWDGAAAAFGGQPLGGGNRQIRSAVYVGPSLLGDEYSTASDFQITQPINAPRLAEGAVFNGQYINNFGFGGYSTDQFTATNILQWTNSNRVEVDSEVLAYQGFLFEEFQNIPNLSLIYGYRNDESTQFLGKNTDSDFNPNLPDGTADPTGGELKSVSEEPIEGDTETKSIVAHIPASWNPFSDHMRLSVHWSESENFQPSSKRRNIFNEPLGPPTGETEDYGFTMSLLEDRLSVRLNWYETVEAGSTSGASGQIGNFFTNSGRQAINTLIEDRTQGRPFVGDAATTTEQGAYTYFVNGMIERGESDPGLIVTTDGAAPNGDPPHVNSTNVNDAASYDNFINAITGLLPDRTQAAVNWRQDENGQFVENFIPGVSAVESRAAEGFEVDIVGNLTKNWSVLLNVGQQTTVIDNVAPDLWAAANEVIENLKSTGFWEANFLNVVKNSLIWRREYTRVFHGALTGIKSREGQISQEQREWRANLVTNYRFTEGRLRGFNLGGAYRWQSKVAIGYDYDYSEEVDLFLPDLNEPIFGPEEDNIDLWVGYNKDIEVFKQDLNWRIQLNVRNAFKGESLIPIGADPDGTLRQFRSPSPTTYYLTNTVSW